jgi:ABC-type sugar transport system ATPase subunit
MIESSTGGAQSQPKAGGYALFRAFARLDSCQGVGIKQIHRHSCANQRQEGHLWRKPDQDREGRYLVLRSEQNSSFAVPGLTEGPCSRLARDVPEGLATATAREVVEDGEDWRADVALDDPAIPQALRDLPLIDLSGGGQRLVILVRVAATEPGLILLDQPTNHLDIEGQKAPEDELTTKGAATLLVSHDRSLIRAVGTRFCWIDKRKLTEVDNPEPFIGQMLSSGAAAP